MPSTKWVVSGATVAVWLWRQDGAVLYFLLGSVLNALLSKLLKRAFKQPRPPGAQEQEPGMPSSHAQSLAFFAVYLSLSVCAVDDGALSPALRVGAVVALCCTALLLAWARVTSGLHTAAQVCVGLCVGASTAAAWWHEPVGALSPAVVDAALQQTPHRSAVAVAIAALILLGLSIKWNKPLQEAARKRA
jgi:dolichyldiphosphatase